MFRRILIANRGEVADRITRTCKRMGIQVVQVVSDADADLQFLSDADELAGLGGVRSYLDHDLVIEAGLKFGATAVHPGWGFLSENPTFAARCESVGMTFIGPSSANMRQMADKAAARSIMQSMGVPVIPGSQGTVETVERAASVAHEIGYPVLLKAVSGGGGRGMRIVRSEGDLGEAFADRCADLFGRAVLAFQVGEPLFDLGIAALERIVIRVRYLGRVFGVVGRVRPGQLVGQHRKLLRGFRFA